MYYYQYVEKLINVIRTEILKNMSTFEHLDFNNTNDDILFFDLNENVDYMLYKFNNNTRALMGESGNKVHIIIDNDANLTELEYDFVAGKTSVFKMKTDKNIYSLFYFPETNTCSFFESIKDRNGDYLVHSKTNISFEDGFIDLSDTMECYKVVVDQAVNYINPTRAKKK